jgi:hypothetical protein
MNVFVECFIGIVVNRCSVVGSRKHLSDTVWCFLKFMTIYFSVVSLLKSTEGPVENVWSQRNYICAVDVIRLVILLMCAQIYGGNIIQW